MAIDVSAMMTVRTRRSKHAGVGRPAGQLARPFASCVVRSLALTGWAVSLASTCMVAIGCHGSASVPRSEPAPVRAALADPSSAFWTTRAPNRFFVRVETTKGDFVIEAHRDWSPRGVDRLYQLVRAGYYDDSRFSRVRAGYIAQWGIAGDPALAQRWRNQRIRDDIVRHTNARGTIAYAMTGPETRTTQLYINLRDNPQLDAQGFSPLGAVVRGMDVVDRLNAEYGESAGGGMRAGHQGPVFDGGNAYLDRNYPRLDHLVRAEIVHAP
ncbi:MAG TPA: peptidylprolyl isomerase [Gemmatimonadaceae bacterium]|jgi:homoserine O-acetyltransferase